LSEAGLKDGRIVRCRWNRAEKEGGETAKICKEVAGLPLKTVNLFQDDTYPSILKFLESFHPASDNLVTLFF